MPLFDYSPILDRAPLRWPDGARVAFYVGMNVEYYLPDAPAITISPATAGLVPDPMNTGWRDYGPRVGIWRIAELLHDCGVHPSVLLNSEVAVHYPQIIEAGDQLGWEWVAHGKNNSTFHTGMDPDAERTFLRDMTDDIEKATGVRPRGWLGPALTETSSTPALLAELGYQYVLDWCNDDQPYRLNHPGMLSVPYSVELNDLTLFATGHATGPQYEQAVLDQLEVLLAEGAHSGRVLAIPIHPFIIGHPFRFKYLAKVIRRIVDIDGVWVTTADQIARHVENQEK